MNLNQIAEDHDKYQPFVSHLDVRTNISVNIVPSAAGSLVMVSLVVMLQQLISHLPPALVPVLSIGLDALSESVFIRLTQKEEIGEIRELIGG